MANNNRMSELVGQFGTASGKVLQGGMSAARSVGQSFQQAGMETAQSMGNFARAVGETAAQPELEIRQREALKTRLSTLKNVKQLTTSDNPKVQQFVKRFLNELEPLAVQDPINVKKLLIDGAKTGLFTLTAAGVINQAANMAIGMGSSGAASQFTSRPLDPTGRQAFLTQHKAGIKAGQQKLAEMMKEDAAFKETLTKVMTR
jgi:hypothetical protein